MSPAQGDRPTSPPARPARRAEALALVFSRCDSTERAQRVEAAGEVAAEDGRTWDSLLVAQRQGATVGGVFSTIQPGRVGTLYPPRLASGESLQTAGSLLDAALDWLVGQEVRLVQCLLPSPEAADDRLLREHGFRRLSNLYYMVSVEQDFPLVEPSSVLRFEPYQPEHQRRLEAIVEATYVETLDCPELNGVRTIDDVLAGYRAAGQFDPARWLIVGHEDEDVGCLLLADHPAHGNWELVYMGVRPQSRGRGWGTEITRYGQWLTRCAGRARLVVAVDSANLPAIQQYQAAGFQVWDRRAVYVKALSGPERP